MTRYVPEAVAAQFLTMGEAIELVEAAERARAAGTAVNEPRQRVKIPGGMLHLLAAALLNPAPGVVGFKAYPAVGGTVHFKIFLYDAASGRLSAIVEGLRLGQLRTGAATAVAARHMTPANACVAAIIGTGFQAEGQVEALACVRGLDELRVWSRSPEKRARFVGRVQGYAKVVVDCQTAEAAVRDADIVVTATTAREPVLQGKWLSPGTFVAAVGANLLSRREIDDDVVARAAQVVVDDREQARRESAALRQAVDKGHANWDRLLTLADVVTRDPARMIGADQIRLFLSHGCAVWDLAVASQVASRARTAHRDIELPIDLA